MSLTRELIIEGTHQRARPDRSEDLTCELCASPAFAGLVLTEVNPTHDPGGELLGRYVDGVTAALAEAARDR